jgi:hypothetical protein
MQTANTTLGTNTALKIINAVELQARPQISMNRYATRSVCRLRYPYGTPSPQNPTPVTDGKPNNIKRNRINQPLGKIQPRSSVPSRLSLDADGGLALMVRDK